jgi:hypothetical protein
MILQQRIHELEDYDVANLSLDNPGTLYFAVDKVGWAKPKRISLDNFIFADHIESGTAVTASTVTVTYGTAFASSDHLLMLQIYKDETMDLGGGNVTVRSSVPYHSLAQTDAGFSLVLAETSGVVVKYFAFE